MERADNSSFMALIQLGSLDATLKLVGSVIVHTIDMQYGRGYLGTTAMNVFGFLVHFGLPSAFFCSSPALKTDLDAHSG